MAKKHEQRPGFLARWFRRLRWLRRAAMIGALAAGVARALGNRSGGSGSGELGGPSGPGGGPGGSGRAAPIGGPMSQRRAAQANPVSGGPEASAATSGARTLVSVPPLVDDDDAAKADGADVVPIVTPEQIDGALVDATGADTNGVPTPQLSLVGDAAAEGERTWLEPLEDGACPPGYPIKANDRSGIFHVPEGRSYKRTIAQRCYPTTDAAAADGYRPAKA